MFYYFNSNDKSRYCIKQFLMLVLILVYLPAYSQILELNPTSTTLLDLNEKEEMEFNEFIRACKEIENKMYGGVKFDDLPQEEKDQYLVFEETRKDYWDVFGKGCNWYCDGGPKEIIASSYLDTSAVEKYGPKNAHDLSYKSVWIMDSEGNGIGEHITYTFRGAAPRITDIIVANGFVESPEKWKNYSRVKRLKVYKDDTPFIILNLEDIRGTQVFEVEPIGNSDRNIRRILLARPDWSLKFEILDVYPGLKFKNVAIAEIYFDGMDVHCFAKGTKVQLSDGSNSNIENLKVGDFITYFDEESKELKTTAIEKLEKTMHHSLVRYHFKSGSSITATTDHPFMIINKGWASLSPKLSSFYQGYDNINKIDVGDVFLTINGTDKLLSVEKLNGSYETYTISKLQSGNNFIANGFIVGVEQLKN